MKNVYAHTNLSGSYPAYISVNEATNGVEITVRSPRNNDGSPGNVAVITLPSLDAVALGDALRQSDEARGCA